MRVLFLYSRARTATKPAHCGLFVFNRSLLMRKLTSKQQTFVDEYLIDLNATQAAIRAGYSQKTAGQIGENLLKKVEIQQSLTERMKAREERTEITQDKVIADIERIKQDAMQRVQDRDGNMIMANHSAALKAAELQGKHLGMFRDKIEHVGKDGGPIKTQDVTEGLSGLYAKLAVMRDAK